jgi:hypothetical protein
MRREVVVTMRMTAAENVVLGWMGGRIPPIPRQRNMTRLSYRKTPARRERRKRAVA